MMCLFSVCDPVMGDSGILYVQPELVSVYQEKVSTSDSSSYLCVGINYIPAGFNLVFRVHTFSIQFDEGIIVPVTCMYGLTLLIFVCAQYFMLIDQVKLICRETNNIMVCSLS